MWVVAMVFNTLENKPLVFYQDGKVLWDGRLRLLPQFAAPPVSCPWQS